MYKGKDMHITRERFEQGMTYEQYREQMTRNRERFDTTERGVELSADDVAFFSRLPRPLNVLVLAEDWCGDVIANLPVLGRLAQESDKLELRVFLRDQNPEIMDLYLNDGNRSIPVFAFFDQDFRPIGHWIERPRRMTELQRQYRRDVFAAEPALAGFDSTISIGELPEEARNALMGAMGAFREQNRALSDREVVRELREVVGGRERTAGEPRLSPASNQVAPAGGTLYAPRRAAAVRERATQPVKVRITYCAECGYQPQTLALASALMEEFLHGVSSIELIPWQDGAFDVLVDGELVHSMSRDGGFPDPADIVGVVRELVG